MAGLLDRVESGETTVRDARTLRIALPLLVTLACLFGAAGAAFLLTLP